MITIQISNAQQAEAIIQILQQGTELEKLKLETYQLTKSGTLDTYLNIMHGESITSQLIAATASLG